MDTAANIIIALQIYSLDDALVFAAPTCSSAFSDLAAVVAESCGYAQYNLQSRC